ncbi:hypothetical protein CEXT_512191 [Caerostris extrusa]|uniref:Uncharacterized protein n=1 Tax=Caerostris extrusa TaxID=172846 RepID=A0AAV4M6Z8_CAEEX|nr:hypothetical protein CEXT_512191 [Caerostris extrusa]
MLHLHLHHNHTPPAKRDGNAGKSGSKRENSNQGGIKSGVAQVEKGLQPRQNCSDPHAAVMPLSPAWHSSPRAASCIHINVLVPVTKLIIENSSHCFRFKSIRGSQTCVLRHVTIRIATDPSQGHFSCPPIVMVIFESLILKDFGIEYQGMREGAVQTH